MPTQRLNYVDAIKFIGITLMIMGHVGFGQTFDKYIHAFHMPIFFVASGYCFTSGRKFVPFLKRKCQSILVPYFFFSILTYFALRKINNIDFSQMNHILWLNNISTPIAGVWFLTALFWANLLYFIIDKIRDNNFKWFFTVILFLLGASIEKTLGQPLPWSLASGMVGVIFVHLGKCLQDNKILQRFSIRCLLGSIIVVSAFIMLNKHVNVRIGEYDNLALFLFNACTMSILLLLLCQQSEAKINGYLYKLACRIGKTSLCYLLINQVAIRYSRIIGEKVFSDQYCPPLFILVISCFIMFILTEAITRTRLSFLLGHWGKNK